MELDFEESEDEVVIEPKVNSNRKRRKGERRYYYIIFLYFILPVFKIFYNLYYHNLITL